MIRPGPEEALSMAADLVSLSRGDDELLLTDPILFRPLHIRRGRRYVLALLDAAAAAGSSGRLREAFPDDGDLIDSLLLHGILVPRDRPPGTPHRCGACASGDASVAGGRKAVSLYLLLSHSCNLACVYCLNGRATYGTDAARRMPLDTAVRSVELALREVSERGSLEIVFFGGEPLLNWETAKETILHCETRVRPAAPGKEIRYHVTSNLSFLPTDLVEWATRYGITFLCDVDGPRDVHDACRPTKGGNGSYDAVVANVRRLVDAGVRVDLRATVTARNQDRLPEIARLHREIGANSTAFVPVSPVNSDEDVLPGGMLPSPERMLAGMVEAYRSGFWAPESVYPFNIHAPRLSPGTRMTHGCGLPHGNTPVVDASGDAYPCIYLVGIRRFFAGNVLDGTYPDRALFSRLHERLHVDRLDECRACALRSLCGGGCPLWRLTVEENPKVCEEVARYCREVGCTVTRGLIETLLWDRAAEVSERVLEGREAG